MNNLGKYLRENLEILLKDNDFYLNIRGRGLRNSLEYSCIEQNLFGLALAEQMFSEHKILISGKWHRVCFSPSLNIKKNELNFFIEKFCATFKKFNLNGQKIIIKK